jgi:hypothetical protein
VKQQFQDIQARWARRSSIAQVDESVKESVVVGICGGEERTGENKTGLQTRIGTTGAGV